MKYVGMTSDIARRKREWEDDREIRAFGIVNKNNPLEYAEAQKLENKLLAECKKCPYCESEGHPGGQPVPGRVYYVYTYYYRERR